MFTVGNSTAVSGTLNESSSVLTVNASTASWAGSSYACLTHKNVVYQVAYTGVSGRTFTGYTIASSSVTVSNGDPVNTPNDATFYAAWLMTTIDPLCPKQF